MFPRVDHLEILGHVLAREVALSHLCIFHKLGSYCYSVSELSYYATANETLSKGFATGDLLKTLTAVDFDD